MSVSESSLRSVRERSVSIDGARFRGGTNLGTNGPPRCGIRGSLARMSSTSAGVLPLFFSEDFYEFDAVDSSSFEVA